MGGVDRTHSDVEATLLGGDQRIDGRTALGGGRDRRLVQHAGTVHLAAARVQFTTRGLEEEEEEEEEKEVEEGKLGGPRLGVFLNANECCNDLARETTEI